MNMSSITYHTTIGSPINDRRPPPLPPPSHISLDHMMFRLEHSLGRILSSRFLSDLVSHLQSCTISNAISFCRSLNHSPPPNRHRSPNRNSIPITLSQAQENVVWFISLRQSIIEGMYCTESMYMRLRSITCRNWGIATATLLHQQLRTDCANICACTQ